MRINVKAYAKINWALDILKKRDDGYHELDMLMQTIDLCDELSFENARWITLSVNDRPIANGSKNLVVRAANALNEYMGEKRGANIMLKKHIPIRAGLGGGSVDCAAALLALNELWRLRLPFQTLSRIGASLGADVPYCMCGGLCRVRGLGEKIDRLDGAREVQLLALHVGAGLSTQAVFGEYDSFGDGSLSLDIGEAASAIIAGDYARADTFCGNALERAAIRLMPGIAKAIEAMRANGARMARMSGSGSTVFGVFDNYDDALRAQSAIKGSILCKTLARPSNEMSAD